LGQVLWILVEGPKLYGEKMFVMHWVWKCEFALNHDLDIMQTYNKNACKVQNMGGLGNWKFEVKVEKMNETFWFNKTQV
jgi:hypothetical protein